jgi:hypothetical protein
MILDKSSSASSCSPSTSLSALSSSINESNGSTGNNSVTTKKKTSILPKFKQFARTTSITQQLTNSKRKETTGDQVGTDTPGSLEMFDADAEMFYSIETRLEMKERLTKCQQCLFPLLLEIKIAWMKCFSTTNAYEEPVVDIGRIQKAKEIVHQGEELTELFLHALDAIETSTTCIESLKENVEKLETHLDIFHTLIKSTANASPPSATSHSCPLPIGGQSATSSVRLFARDSQFVTYDLPSMKAYCQKVAPPVSSYFLSKNSKTRQKNR